MRADALRNVSGAPRLYANQLEPTALVDAFLRYPPQDFARLELPGQEPAFVADFDLLTTADDSLKHRASSLPAYGLWSRWLKIRTAFVGTTVSEYVLFCRAGFDAVVRARAWRERAKEFALLVVKDIPAQSPLLDEAANRNAAALVEACTQQGYVIVEGQQLAYVPLDFADIDAYLARLSASRRKNIRRKLRSREHLEIRRVATGAPQFDDPAVLDRYYAMYLDVYAQSEVHFDLLSKAFFTHVLGDAGSGGLVFEYHSEGKLVGYNICFEHEGNLVDKYVGFVYPQAREHNLYAVSWFVNLEYALARGLKHYVAGWTDPQVKSDLGASFTPTLHAVYVRNPLLRVLARRLKGNFEADRNWRENKK